MSRRIFVGCEDALAPFMNHMCQAHGAFNPAIGRGFAMVEEEEQRILAGVWFEGFNGVNMFIHVAAVPGGRWLNRMMLSLVFHYAFIQTNARRLTGLVEETNYAARRFDEHLGFTLEARLKDAAPGGDLLVYVMRKDACRFLNMKGGLPATRLGVH